MLMKINHPINVKEFANYFQTNVLDFIPNVFYSNSKEEKCNLNIFLVENEVSCNALNNTGHLIFEMVIYLAIVVIVKVLKVAIYLVVRQAKRHEKNDDKSGSEYSQTVQFLSQVSKIPKAVDNYIGLSLFWSLMNSMELDFFIGSWPILTVKGKKHPYFFISNILLIFLVLCFGWYIWKGIEVYIKSTNIRRNSLSREETQDNLQKLKNQNLHFYNTMQSFRSECFISPIISAFMCLRDLTIPFCIIYFVDYPMVPISIIFIFTLSNLILTIVYSPYVDYLDQLTTIVNEVLYLLVLVLFSVLSIFDDNMSPYFKFNFLGFNIVAIFTFLLGFNVLIGFIVIGRQVWSFLRAWKSKVPDSGTKPDNEPAKILKTKKDENEDKNQVLNIKFNSVQPNFKASHGLKIKTRLRKKPSRLRDLKKFQKMKIKDVKKENIKTCMGDNGILDNF